MLQPKQSTCLGMSQAYMQVKSHMGKGPEQINEFWLLKANWKKQLKNNWKNFETCERDV